jgi:hypothetical protein
MRLNRHRVSQGWNTALPYVLLLLCMGAVFLFAVR